MSEPVDKRALVAIDCTAETWSVAVLAGDRVHEYRSTPDEGRSERLLQRLDELLGDAQLATSRIGAVAVAIGPGIFTGVRLAVAAAQGLALAWDVPVVPVSSLAALALCADGSGLPVLAVQDARMGEIYSGWFRIQPGDHVVALTPERVHAPAHAERPDGAGDYVLVESGLGDHRPALVRVLGEPVRTIATSGPSAAHVARLALASGLAHVLAPEAVEPTYLRNKVALTSQEQQALKAQR